MQELVGMLAKLTIQEKYMKRFITFGAIGQFRHAVRTIQHAHWFSGMKDGVPQYDPSRTLPVITAVGTEKIHGTNAAVCYSEPDGFWVQSRKGVITPEKDNAGCAFMATAIEHIWMSLIQKLANEYAIDLKTNVISLYFEWCGGNIQKLAAVSGLPKRAIIFQHFKVSPLKPLTEDPDAEDGMWYTTTAQETPINDHGYGIYNVLDFPYVELGVDFNSPAGVINEMAALTAAVEKNSGVAAYFKKPENTGEGYVWTLVLENGSLLRWKTKGEEHSASKVKVLAPVDVEELQRKQDFSARMCPACRLEQAWQTVFGIENENLVPSEAYTGDIIRAVFKDIMKEEQDAFVEAGYVPKDVNGMISKVVRIWFFEQLNASP